MNNINHEIAVFLAEAEKNVGTAQESDLLLDLKGDEENDKQSCNE